MLLEPNLDCVVTTSEGFDIYGEPTNLRTYAARCALVRLLTASEKSEVRADSSASRGKVDQLVNDARLLFPADVVLRAHDVIALLGLELRVVSVFPRVDLNGVIDHWQVDCDRKA